MGKPRATVLLIAAILAGGIVWLLGMDSVHRVYDLYDIACELGSEFNACNSIGDAIQFLQAIVWIASIATLIAVGWGLANIL
jgi:hypothetical protein